MITCLVWLIQKNYLLHYFIISCYDFISLFIWYFGVKSSQPYLSNSHHLSSDIKSSLLSSHVLISVILFYPHMTCPFFFSMSSCYSLLLYSPPLFSNAPLILFTVLQLSAPFFFFLLFSSLFTSNALQFPEHYICFRVDFFHF